MFTKEYNKFAVFFAEELARENVDGYNNTFNNNNIRIVYPLPKDFKVI